LNHLLEIYEAKGSKYTCLYADGLMHLSLLKTEEGKYAEAEQHVREAMRIKTTHLGYDHFHIALVYINLAQTLYEKDKSHVFNDFNDLMKEGINILKKNEIPTSHILMEKLLEVQKKSLDTKKILIILWRKNYQQIYYAKIMIISIKINIMYNL